MCVGGQIGSEFVYPKMRQSEKMLGSWYFGVSVKRFD